MGNTIHYQYKITEDIAQDTVIEKLNKVRDYALELKRLGYILRVGDIVIRTHRQITKQHMFRSDYNLEKDGHTFPLNPIGDVYFKVQPTGYSDELIVGMVHYPLNTPYMATKIIPEKVTPWIYRGFAKPDIEENGIARYMVSYYSMLAILAYTKYLGFLTYLHDEGGFWDTRFADTALAVSSIDGRKDVVNGEAISYAAARFADLNVDGLKSRGAYIMAHPRLGGINNLAWRSIHHFEMILDTIYPLSIDEKPLDLASLASGQ